MSDGYAYTTINVSKDEPTHIGVSLHLDDHAWIAVCSDPDKRRTHLSIVYGDVTVNIAPVPGEVTARDARMARTLADQAAAYAAEVERLATGNANAAA